MSVTADLDAFHRRFGFKPRATGVRPSKKLVAFRLKFLMEELNELSTALSQDDLEEATDALVDLVYVAVGTAWLLNLPFAEAWETVHAANMRKVRATDPTASKRGSDLDVVKPVGWVKPNVAAHLHPADLLLAKDQRIGDGEQLSILDYLKKLETDLALGRKHEQDPGDNPA